MAEKLYDAYHQEIELTTEQQACLKYTGDRTLMVKGYAGAGKSLVLMAIAQKYLAKYGFKQKNKVAIFTFQNTLVSTTKEFLHVNGGDEEGVIVSTVNSYLKAIYDELFRIGKAPRQTYPNTNKKDKDKPKRLKCVEMALNKHQTKYGKHRFHDLPATKRCTKRHHTCTANFYPKWHARGGINEPTSKQCQRNNTHRFLRIIVTM